jgi:hypothetical protein
MSSHSKLISATKAKEMLGAGEAVLAGSEEHQRMMMALWEQVARKFAYIVSAGKWTYRDKGTDRGLVADYAAQRSIDADYRTALPVLRYGRTDGQVRIAYESPQLGDVTNPFLEVTFEKHRRLTKQELTLPHLLIVDFWDTYPGKPRIVDLGDGPSRR